MTLGRLLKDARSASGMTLRDVEKLTRISNGYISLLESDAIKQPSPPHLHELAKAYSLDYGQLMELAGYVAPSQVPSAGSVMSPDASSASFGDLTDSELREVDAFVRGLRASRRISKKK